MENPPTSAPPAFGRRPPAAEDEPFILELFASTLELEMALAAAWPAGQREAFLRQQCAAQRQSYQARYPEARCEIITLGGRAAGRFWVGRDAEQIRLLDISLLPEARGRGIGSALIGELQAEARQTGLALRHCVFKLNEGARRLYRRLGFVVIDDLGTHELMEWRPE